MMTHVLPPAGMGGLAAAVAAFAAAPSRQGRFHVMRWCLYGPLLLDPSSSEPGRGPDGEPALFAYTSDAGRGLHQRAPADVLGTAASGHYRWLVLDPAGPSCALARHDVEFALRGDRNDAVRAALGDSRTEDTDRRVAEALAAGGSLVLGVDPTSITGTEGGVRLRSATDPGGDVYLLAFTSGAEGISRHASDSFASRPVEQVLAMVVDGPYAGLVVNPSGPTATLPSSACSEVLATVGDPPPS